MRYRSRLILSLTIIFLAACQSKLTPIVDQPNIADANNSLITLAPDESAEKVFEETPLTPSSPLELTVDINLTDQKSLPESEPDFSPDPEEATSDDKTEELKAPDFTALVQELITDDEASFEDEDLYFDPSTITAEIFDSTKTDVQKLIILLNDLIRQRDFLAWEAYLGLKYKQAISDQEFLDRISQSSILRRQNIILRSIEDYFFYVVVPSRANDRVDDIEFIGKNRVKAFTINNKGQRLRLYDLEKTPNGWKIIN